MISWIGLGSALATLLCALPHGYRRIKALYKKYRGASTRKRLEDEHEHEIGPPEGAYVRRNSRPTVESLPLTVPSPLIVERAAQEEGLRDVDLPNFGERETTRDPL